MNISPPCVTGCVPNMIYIPLCVASRVKSSSYAGFSYARRRTARASDPRDFDLIVRYDEERGIVDSFLRSRDSHDVTNLQGGMTRHSDEGEFVHTECTCAGPRCSRLHP